MTNTELLQKEIERSGMKINAILRLMNIGSYSTLRAKIENRSEFSASEITRLCEILDLDNDQREAIFFAADAEYHSA